MNTEQPPSKLNKRRVLNSHLDKNFITEAVVVHCGENETDRWNHLKIVQDETVDIVLAEMDRHLKKNRPNWFLPFYHVISRLSF